MVGAYSCRHRQASIALCVCSLIYAVKFKKKMKTFLVLIRATVNCHADSSVINLEKWMTYRSIETAR
jgi:hypothetical protein